jgi:exodeoxyribonuclease-3
VSCPRQDLEFSGTHFFVQRTTPLPEDREETTYLGVRLATFNVNSIRARIGATTAWIEQRRPDVVMLQETKVTDAEFPSEEFTRAGYGLAISGQKSYNGVALLSRLPVRDVRIGLVGDLPEDEKRYISASIAGLRCVSVYVPNGKEVGHPAFLGKLAWLKRLNETLQAEISQYGHPVVMGGDFNIALDELDVWSTAVMQGMLHFHPDERAELRELMTSNELVDAFRITHPETQQFTWWDYRGPSLRLNRGLRIDYLFVSRTLISAVDNALVDAEVRRGDRPSDHVPVVVDLSP